MAHFPPATTLAQVKRSLVEQEAQILFFTVVQQLVTFTFVDAPKQAIANQFVAGGITLTQDANRTTRQIASTGGSGGVQAFLRCLLDEQ